jgi:starvation-inducible DNA-binding protein
MTTSPKGQAQAQIIKSYPAPSPLATLTDLKSEEVQAITEAINPLIADSFALYTKTKNYHWHVAGSHFRDYHKLFDEQAEALLKSTDTLAERVRCIGGTTIRSISHINQLQTIQDDNRNYVPVGEMVRQLMEDNKRLVQMQRAAHEVCVRNHDVATASVIESLIDKAERRTWYLFEIVQDTSNTH